MAGFAYWRYCCDMRLTYVSRTDDTKHEGKGLTRITDRSCAMLRRNAALNEFNRAVQRNTRVNSLTKNIQCLATRPHIRLYEIATEAYAHRHGREDTKFEG